MTEATPTEAPDAGSLPLSTHAIATSPAEPPKFLILSRTHHLLPLAWRLSGIEGHEVEVIVERDRFEVAWSGRLGKRIEGFKKRSRAYKDGIAETVMEAGAYVLTDSPKWAEILSGYERLYPTLTSPPRGATPPGSLGAWFDGADFTGKHLVYADFGMWPGGMGPKGIGGLTLIRPEIIPGEFEDTLAKLVPTFSQMGFRGLVRVTANAEGEIVWDAGWHLPHYHAFIAEMGDMGTPTLAEVVMGYEPQFPSRFTVAMPVSIPPYPIVTNEPGEVVEVRSKVAQSGRIFFHDMKVEEGKVKTAGLDGLIGVVRASGANLHWIRKQVVSLAMMVGVPELQFRPDVGGKVDEWLGGLEAKGWVI